MEQTGPSVHRVIRVVFLMVLAAWTNGCVLPPPGQDRDLEDRIIVAARAVGQGGHLDFSDLLSRPAGQAVVILSYTLQEDVDDALGFHWSEASRTGVFEQDGHLVVTIDDGEVVDWAFLSPQVDFRLNEEEAYRTIPFAESTLVEEAGDRVVLCPAPCPIEP